MNDNIGPGIKARFFLTHIKQVKVTLYYVDLFVKQWMVVKYTYIYVLYIYIYVLYIYKNQETSIYIYIYIYID